MTRGPFNLKRWFATLGLLSIAGISLVSAWLLSEFLTARMVRQEARLTQEVIDSLVRVEQADGFFVYGQTSSEDVRDFFEHVMQLPDVLRVNLYSRKGQVIWSSDPTLIGRQFADNPELEQALGGTLVAHGGRPAKREHVDLDAQHSYFVEIYSPVRADRSGTVIGVVEMYRAPRALFDAIGAGQRAIWLGAALAGAFMYAALFWMVRRADNLIREQGERLVQSETLAAIGEMSSAVAHGIRNPLASIRSSAELALGSQPPGWSRASPDIIEQVDRLESWVRELLAYSQPLAARPEPVALGALLKASLQGFEREFERRGIRASAEVPDDLSPVTADALMLGQVFNSLIANAVEAMESGGSLTLSVKQEAERLRVRIHDTGPGMTREQLANAFKPFHTTKPKGVGVGLALARRIVQRFGGTIVLASEPGRGTVIDVLLPAT